MSWVAEVRSWYNGVVNTSLTEEQCQVRIDGMNEPRPHAARASLTAAGLALAAVSLGVLAATLVSGTWQVVLIVVAVLLVGGAGVALGLVISATRLEGPGPGGGHGD